MITSLIVLFGVVMLCLPLGHRVFWKYASLILTIVAGFYFFYDPPSVGDLYRHYLLLDDIRSYGWDASGAMQHMFERYWNESPFFIILLLLVSIFPYNGFLPFLVTATYYNTVLHGIHLVKSLGYENIGTDRLSVIALLLCTDYRSFEGIRNSLACALFLLGTYLDLIKGKKIGFLFYIVAALIHSVGFIYILMRVLLFFYNKNTKYLLLMGTFLLPFILTTGANGLESITSNIPIISNIVSRFQLYTVEGAGLGVFSQNWRILNTVTYIFLYFLSWVYEFTFDKDNRYTRFFLFFTFLMLFTFGFYGQRELFERERFLIMPIGIIFSALLKQSSFRRFPFVAHVVEERYTLSILAPLLYYAFLVWAVLYFILLALLSYPLDESMYSVWKF